MKTFVSKVKNNIIFFACLVSFCSCNGQNSYDPDLMTPDTDEYGRNFGFNYTNLGMLVSYPWEYGGEVNSDTTDFKDFSVKSKISDISKRDLVFELQKNGTIKFWFKSEYKGNIFDTVTQLDGIKSLSKKLIRSDNPIIKKIYTTGSWKVNFKDSSIVINFGKNDFNLEPIDGKYYLLNTRDLCIEKLIGIASTSGTLEKNKYKISCLNHNNM